MPIPNPRGVRVILPLSEVARNGSILTDSREIRGFRDAEFQSIL